MVPGIVVVWSGSKPRFDTFRVGDGLVFGRDLFTPPLDDERVSRDHAHVHVADDGLVEVLDRGSRNGTYVSGYVVVANTPVRVRLPAIVRTGRTVFVVVADIRGYEHIPISRREALAIGGTLDKPVRELDVAALDGAHVVLVGPRSVTRPLAHAYALATGGEHVVFDQPRHLLLEPTLAAAARPRSILLELTAPLQPQDVTCLATWLETDVRCVTCVRAGGEVAAFLAPELRARLAERTIQIPRFRFDELPTTFADQLAEIAPGATLHASAIESLLLLAITMPEDLVLATFVRRARAWRQATPPDQAWFRAIDLAEDELRGDPSNAWCIFPRNG